MATYRKPLIDKAGNYIIPVIDNELCYLGEPSGIEPIEQDPWIESAMIQDNAVTKNKIDFNTLKNNIETVVAISSDNGTITLPSGYDMYEITGYVDFSTSSASSGIQIKADNYSGTTTAERIIGVDASVSAYKNSYSDGTILLFGATADVGTASGGVYVNFKVIRRQSGTGISAFGNFKHRGISSYGSCFGEYNIPNTGDPITFSFISRASARTFSGAKIIATGIKI